jgi:deazaflavin-dependent oxidoreductase (nitroreductase family)
MKINPTLTKLVSRLHVTTYRLTGGRIGGTMMGCPVLLLTTTGRTTGKQRTTPLLYLKDGDDLIVVASYGGFDRDPAWWTNLKAHPDARVLVGSHDQAVVATQVSAQEKPRLWALLNRMYPSYEEYQRQTSREIPVVRLHPKG